MTTDEDYLPTLLHHLNGLGAAQATDLLATAADQHPSDPRPLLLLGAELAQDGQFDRAEAAYTLAIQRAPEFWIARFQLGLLQFSGARPAVASVTWAPLDALPDTHALRLFKLGLEQLAQDHYTEAVELLRAGIAKNNDNQPLNSDMLMLINKLIEQGLVNEAATTEPVAAEPAAEHFLFSAYRNLH